MSRYKLTVENNVFFDLVEMDEEDYDEDEDEILGIDWAMIEVRDGIKNLKKIDGEYTLANKDEAVEFLQFLQKFLAAHVQKQIDEQLGG